MKKIRIILLLVFCLLLVACESDDYNEENKKRFSEISFNVPEVFEEDKDYIYLREFYYKGDNVYCYVNFSASDKSTYSDDKETWFKKQIRFSLNDKVSELEEVDIYDNKAYKVTVQSGKDFDYYYGFESTNHYYLLDYQITDYNEETNEDIQTNPCYKYIDEIVYSIKLK